MTSCPQCGGDCKATGGWLSSGFICKKCNRVLLPSQSYVRTLAIISVLPAIGVVLFFVVAGYPEAVFTSVVFLGAWLVSFLLLSFLGHRLLPPRLVMRHFDSIVTLDLDKEDELKITSKH